MALARTSSLWVCFLAWSLALLLAPAWAQLAVPPLAARVTDLAGLLSAAQRQALEDRLARFEQEKGSQIAILIVPTTRPETIEQYGIRVAEAWRLGRKGVDDGVLILVARDDRALRIEVGYGLEGVVPDAVAKRIIEEIIVPRFRAGDYAGGLEAGVAALTGLISGEPLPPPRPVESAGSGPHPLLPAAMMFAFVVGGFLRFFLGRLTAAGVVGTLAFFGAWWLLGSLLAALFVAAIAFVITLSGSVRGLVGSGRRGSGGGWTGGGLGGGFRGGGGGFGGGGASGRW
ncbi:MAG: TPM domain-containing protein [Thiobacillaceae bacterium]